MSEDSAKSGSATERTVATRSHPDRCRECGRRLGCGYLCDDCDTVEGWDE
jgi:hypothetical protein